MEQAQFYAVFGEYLNQFQLRLVQFPVGRDVSAVLVAVGIAQHDFLGVAAIDQQLTVVGNSEKFVHDRSAAAQIFDGLEQRNDVDVQCVIAFEQAHLLQHQRQLQHVAHRICLGNDVVRQCGAAKALVDVCRGLHDAQFALYNV